MIVARHALFALLRAPFGCTAFRAGQREAIEAALAGRDTLVCLPTGAGKSLCFQLAALALKKRGRGPTLVVSPLTALMNDQVQALRRLGVNALCWHSGLPDVDARAAEQQLFSGRCDIAYLSPERLLRADVLRRIAPIDVPLVAIDEAHCTSLWGHDFRPDYRALGRVRQVVSCPVMAVTATATEATLRDIARVLALQSAKRIVQPSVRDNLQFEVMPEAPLRERLARLPRAVTAFFEEHETGALIVYAATRKTATEAHRVLDEAGVASALYHAGLTASARERVERTFLRGASRLIVATCAFGMGIDRADVRWVLHLQCPARIEALYQEAGRAGRDGLPARCSLWWGPQDLLVHRRLHASLTSETARRAAQAGLDALCAYATTHTCRQRALAAAFVASTADACGRCDVCVGTAAQVAPMVHGQAPKRRTLVLTEEQRRRIDRSILEMAATMARPVGQSTLALGLRGSKAMPVRRRGLHRLPSYGSLSDVAAEAIAERIAALLQERKLERRGKKYPTVWLCHRPLRAAAPNVAIAKRRGQSPLRLALMRMCRAKAKELGWKKPYMVLPKKVMLAIERARPSCDAQLLALPGLGSRKVALFGDDITRLVAAYAKEARRDEGGNQSQKK